MRFILCILVALLAASSASAQGWKRFTYSAYAFSVTFPSEPSLETTTYQASDGRAVAAHVYSATHGNTLLRVTVAELAGAPVDDTAVVEHAVMVLTQGNAVRLDVPHHVGVVQGRQLSIDRADGSHAYVAVFYRKWRLYQVEGIAPSSDPAASADAIRFQQSIDFLSSLDFAQRPGAD
jgi:hypothetical protein